MAPLTAFRQVYLSAAADTGGDLARRPKDIYFDKMKGTQANEAATSLPLARELWELSERLTGIKPTL